MGRRTVVLFWGALASAVFFLGTVWSAAGALGSRPHADANAAVLAVALTGFVVTALVAARIAFVIGRAQRRARTHVRRTEARKG